MVKIHKQRPSGIALINVSECGENSISVAPGSNNELLPEDIYAVEEQIKTADIILVQLEIPLNTVEAIVKVANRNNIPIILNPAPAQRIEQEILKSIDIITPNETEAAVLAEKCSNEIDVNELNMRLREMGLKTIIITLGSKGAFYSKDGKSKVIEASKVEAIDSTAAGDVFNGYLAVSLAMGHNLEAAIRMANKAASISVTRLGAQPSIPFLKEVL
jgi:ribokinase